MKKALLIALSAGCLAVAGMAPAQARPPEEMRRSDVVSRQRPPMDDLSQEQMEKMKAVMREARKLSRPLRNRNAELLDTLRDQVEDKASDEELSKTLAAIDANRRELQDRFEKTQAQFNAILTPAQRAQRLLEKPHRFGRSDRGRGGNEGKRGRFSRHQERSAGEERLPQDCPFGDEQDGDR